MDVTVFTADRGSRSRSTSSTACWLQFSQQWLRSLENVPQRTEGSPVYDAALAATPANGDQAKPVGLGAFKFESYSPGNGNSFKAVRNPDYWRGPNGITGEDLPYLDAVEAVVAVDEDEPLQLPRRRRVRHHDDVDGRHHQAGSSTTDVQDQLVDATARRSTCCSTSLPATDDPEGKNASSPLLNLDCRKALAHAIDRDRWAAGARRRPAAAGQRSVPAGLGRLPRGHRLPGVRHREGQGLDGHVPRRARHRPHRVLVQHHERPVQRRVEHADRVDVEGRLRRQGHAQITPIEQGQYIGLALTGTFQAFGWRNHGGLDPDQQRLWWQSSSALPIGSLALNFGRFQDPEMDAQLDIIKSNPDPAARKAAAEEVNRIFGEKVYNWWQAWAVWGDHLAALRQRRPGQRPPGRHEGHRPGVRRAPQTNQIWCDDGKCE